MKNVEKIYTGLCVLFSVLIVVGNLTYQKFVILSILPFHTFEISVGAVLYPLTFLITDLITEFYGKEKARFCVRFAVLTKHISSYLLLVWMRYQLYHGLKLITLHFTKYLVLSSPLKMIQI